MDSLPGHLLECIAVLDYRVWWLMAISVAQFGRWTLDANVQKRGRDAFTRTLTTITIGDACQRIMKWNKFFVGRCVEWAVKVELYSDKTNYACNLKEYESTQIFLTCDKLLLVVNGNACVQVFKHWCRFTETGNKDFSNLYRYHDFEASPELDNIQLIPDHLINVFPPLKWYRYDNVYDILMERIGMIDKK